MFLASLLLSLDFLGPILCTISLILMILGQRVGAKFPLLYACLGFLCECGMSAGLRYMNIAIPAYEWFCLFATGIVFIANVWCRWINGHMEY